VLKVFVREFGKGAIHVVYVGAMSQ
jgi:hypothetical protein